MKTVFESITTFLKADGWSIHQIQGQTAYSMQFEGDNGKWICIAQALNEENQFIFYSSCPVKTPENKRQQIAELLTRINYTLLLGNFEMSFLNGDIRHRTSIDITGHELGAFLIQKVVYTNVLNMNMYLPVILNVIERDITPLEALYELLEKAS